MSVKSSLEIQTNISLASYTTLKIGGPADYFVDVESSEDIIEAIAFAKEHKIPYYLLGAGSNVLVSDRGFKGLIIHLRNTKYEIQNTTLTAEAGTSLPILAKATVEKGLSGLEFGIGVPGTIGGAVYGNAGAFGEETKDVIASVELLLREDDFKRFFEKNNCYIVKLLNCYDTRWALAHIDNNACEFAYRESIFKRHKTWTITSVACALKQEDTETAKKRMFKMLQDKTTHQPMGELAAGSIFKNPPGFHAWELIAEAEMRSYKIGGAQVSEQHANYIINTGSATAEHIVILIAMIKQRVRVRSRVQLQEEIQYVGF